MAAFNKVILIGRLTRDPELRYTPNGQPVVNFSIAVDRKFSKNDETDFIPIVAWRRLAEICNEFLHKGKLVAIEGSLQVRSYEDKDGKRRTAFEVVADDMQMLEPKGAGGASGGSSAGGNYGGASRSTKPAMAASASRGGDYDDGGSSGGGFPPSDDNLGIDDIPF